MKAAKKRHCRLFWLVNLLSVSRCITGQAITHQTSDVVPEMLCSPYGTYPNLLGISDADRASFSPVIKFPTIWSETYDGGRERVLDITVEDHSPPVIPGRTQLATLEEINLRAQQVRAFPKWLRRIKWQVQSLPVLRNLGSSTKTPTQRRIYYGIGRYDENRIGMYNSEMFQNTDHNIDGYAGARTVHVGIDLAGPLGTPVLAFADGIVHSLGYNADRGDYGHVMVIEHTVPSNGRKLWALYGHLDEDSIKNMVVGQEIRKGQQIGRLGDIYDNGGWHLPHVHFQISTKAPKTHDMPGAVAVADRPEALLHYPDPRWVLGMLY